MGIVQEIAPSKEAALEVGIEIANKIAACGPLGIKATLESAHLAFDDSRAAAFAKLDEQYVALYHTDDFIEGRKAEAENRSPVFHGRWPQRPGGRLDLAARARRATSHVFGRPNYWSPAAISGVLRPRAVTRSVTCHE
jgi:hypothetical protein